MKTNKYEKAAFKRAKLGTANTYIFSENQVMTDIIRENLKTGDIVIVNKVPFVITKESVTCQIRGTHIIPLGDAIHMFELSWVENQKLSFTSKIVKIK